MNNVWETSIFQRTFDSCERQLLSARNVNYSRAMLFNLKIFRLEISENQKVTTEQLDARAKDKLASVGFLNT